MDEAEILAVAVLGVAVEEEEDEDEAAQVDGDQHGDLMVNV